uniref:Uncharacterized protein n=1 Tax=Sphaerodactylus townsendi TaxID=933632 RepID=A0ACB8F4M7_9SAUR
MWEGKRKYSQIYSTMLKDRRNVYFAAITKIWKALKSFQPYVIVANSYQIWNLTRYSFILYEIRPVQEVYHEQGSSKDVYTEPPNHQINGNLNLRGSVCNKCLYHSKNISLGKEP